MGKLMHRREAFVILLFKVYKVSLSGVDRKSEVNWKREREPKKGDHGGDSWIIKSVRSFLPF